MGKTEGYRVPNVRQDGRRVYQNERDCHWSLDCVQEMRAQEWGGHSTGYVQGEHRGRGKRGDTVCRVTTEDEEKGTILSTVWGWHRECGKMGNIVHNAEDAGRRVIFFTCCVWGEHRG